MALAVHQPAGERPNDPRQNKPIPVFVPRWMYPRSEPLMLHAGGSTVFDPERALHGAIRSGDVELAGRLIDHYGLDVDKPACLKQAQLNGDLIRAVDKRDVEAVRTLLEQGASIRAATYCLVSGSPAWFTAYQSALNV